MSEERSDATEETHESEGESAADDAGDVNAPGGGPRRVVSDQSVDDILESLDSTRSQGPPATDDQDAEDDSDSADDEATRAAPAGDDADTRGGDDANGADSSDDETEPTTDDGLAARVESGTVTGSDVRAAEAGEGREPTPDVGEIDLSIDDLTDGDETDGPLAGTLEDEGPEPSESNPAAGDDSVDEDEDEDEDEDDGGLLGRIRRFFS
ncbi:hypothetical protein ACFOZ7_08420 [Natribaculum luteum]|uniref:Uncharacterized protein n=1 Tax=Natribaculum luteum TaxID=1586232 RepID=A0ABD5NYY4_9EURY|nr:hypothetical protein [Natribaculum luteum]